MKVVILAGGLGTRFAEYTNLIPKPMVPIGDKPILWHIMQRFADFGHVDFYIALGYKADVIKRYFLDYFKLSGDFTVNLATGTVDSHRTSQLDWKVTLVDTGESTMTGGRLLRLKSFIGDEPFLLTYGDGLADIDLDNLVDFHYSHGKIATVTAVRPLARFGELRTKGAVVKAFEEKPQLNQGWVSGGFFVFQPEFLEHIEGDSTMLEREPLESVATNGGLMAYKHEGFWQCMDNKRDHEYLENLWHAGAPWVR